MNWKFWKKKPEANAYQWQTITFGGSSTSSTKTNPPTVAEQIEALTKRVAELEKDATVFDDSGTFYFISSSGGGYTQQKSRPRVGEGVRLLMKHLGLTFKHGTTSPDGLVKAKKSKK